MVTRNEITGLAPIQIKASAADTAGLLLAPVACLPPSALMEEVNDFLALPEGRRVVSVPIVDGGKPLGLISRAVVIEKFSQRFFRELHGKKPVTAFMKSNALVVEHSISLDELSHIISEGDQGALADGFIITEGGRYLGMGTGHGLVRELAQRKEAHLYHMAYHDVLTGLPNRQLFYDRLHQALAQAQRHGRDLAVFFIDLDHFKMVNDSLGHQAGDQLLVLVSERLKRCLRESDTLARLGGDEFTAVLTEMKQSSDALSVAQGILQALAEPFQVLGHEVHVTTSLGISLYPADGDAMETLVKNADNALYQAKETRNDYRFFKASMNELASQRQKLEAELRAALSEGQLLLQYRPQFDLGSGDLRAAEVCVQWSHPSRGWVEAEEFARLVGPTSLAQAVDRWVLRTACLRAADWQAKGLKPVRLLVRLSPLEFKRSDFVPYVAGVMRETGLEPHWLVVEVVERVLLDKNPETQKSLEALHALGIDFSLADFGGENSSLAYLRRGLIDEFTVQGSLVARAGVTALESALVAGLGQVARALGARVVAEGVDKQPQHAFLADYGCQEARGPMLGGALSASWFEDLLLKQGPVRP